MTSRTRKWEIFLPISPSLEFAVPNHFQLDGLLAGLPAGPQAGQPAQLGPGADSLGKIFKIDARAEFFNDVRTTTGGTDWQMQTQLQFLFIRHKRTVPGTAGVLAPLGADRLSATHSVIERKQEKLNASPRRHQSLFASLPSK
jgi:hypothetical protein